MMPGRRGQKVFGVGFHKTGTTSLAAALYMLGYNVCGYFGNRDTDIATTAVETAFDLADRYDAAQDTPWPVLYRELDERYPNSRFILTIRPSDQWVASVVKHFKRHRIPSHEWIYGVPTAADNEATYVERYERHNAEVIEYFADRPESLLVMDLGRGDGWDELCPFLDLRVPTEPFPTQNTAQQKSKDLPRRAFRGVTRRVRATITDQNSLKDKEATAVAKTISADFLRSLIHLHHTRFDDVVAVIIDQGLSDPRPQGWQLPIGLAELISEQIYSELETAARLDISIANRQPVPGDLMATIERWEGLRTSIRAKLAELDDIEANNKTAGGEARVWEVLLDMFDAGVERQTRMRMLVEDHGGEIPRRSFVGSTA